MKKQWKKWTNEEIELLKIHWKSSSMETLLKQFPNRNYNSLMNKAKEVGVKSEAQRKRKGSFDFLDKITTDSAFWWGFIIADGYLSPRGELSITIHNKDVKYLEILANKLNVKLKFYKKFTRLAMQSKIFGGKWLKIFNINSPKTYTPPYS